MKKETMNMAIEKLNEHVEVFCNEPYKDYYVRGVIRQMFFDTDGGPYKMEDVFADYRYATLALVNDRYQERIRKRWESMYPPPFLLGNTEKDYLDTMNSYANRFAGSDMAGIESLLSIYLHPTVLISLDEAEVTQSQYLDDCIKKAKDIILLHADLVFSKPLIESQDTKISDFAERIYTIPVFYFLKGHEYDPDPDFNSLEKEYNSFYMDFGCDYPSKREYCAILESIGTVGYEWVKEKKITRSYVGRLNRANKRIGDRTYPVMDFCGKFLDDLVDELTTNKLIGKCLHCGDFFRWPKGVRIKKYCSPKIDGKNCAKAAADHRRYEKGKPETLERRRKDIREARALYKQLGIKK